MEKVLLGFFALVLFFSVQFAHYIGESRPGGHIDHVQDCHCYEWVVPAGARPDTVEVASGYQQVIYAEAGGSGKKFQIPSACSGRWLIFKHDPDAILTLTVCDGTIRGITVKSE